MSAVIRSVLSPLIKLWLRSQVESIQTLEIEVTGRDGQILKGLIPSAKVIASDVVYQGLHLTNLSLTASQIHLNTPQVLRREPLKLLEPIQVDLELDLAPDDLKYCLGSVLVRSAVGMNLLDRNQLEDDQYILFTLTQILTKLGDEFKLKDLSVNNGYCHCEGIFIVNAT